MFTFEVIVNFAHDLGVSTNIQTQDHVTLSHPSVDKRVTFMQNS